MEDGRNPLTERQHQCLKWASEGKTFSEIAIILDISEHTVGHHLRAAQERLNASNNCQAVATAIRQGLI